MPKIVINEYDKTKAGDTEYSNFSVVVPGFVGTAGGLDDKGNSVFDANGVYECDNARDFEKYIGVEDITENVIAVGAKVTKKFAPANGAATITPTDFYHTYRGHIYVQEVIAEAAEKVIGKLVAKETDGDTETYYKYTQVKQDDDTEDIISDTATYCYIQAGDEGRDAGEALTQIGNKIAYKLLQMGYTVLYKKLDETTPWGNDSKKGATALETAEFWDCLRDRAAYDFRYLITGGYYNALAYEQMSKIATFKNDNYITDYTKNLSEQGRGDCIALVDIIESGLTKTNGNKTEQITETDTQSAKLNAIKKQVNSWSWANKYVAIFCPRVIYDDGVFPASLHYLACASRAFTENGYSEWYAVAGYNRGVCNEVINGTKLGPFGEIAINTLEPRYSNAVEVGDDEITHSVNVIAKIRNNYYLWGNRTAHTLIAGGSDEAGLKASHFLNIRQLCCTLKKELYIACRRFTFSPNSDLLWTNFCDAIRPTLEKMKSDQGITDYKLIKVNSSTKALLKAKIRIVPIEAVEDFEMNVYLEDSIAGVNVVADE